MNNQINDNASKQPTLTQNGFLGFLHGNEQETKHESSESTVKTTVKIYEKEKKSAKQLIAEVWFKPQKSGRFSFDHSHHKAAKSHRIILIIPKHKLTTECAR